MEKNYTDQKKEKGMKKEQQTDDNSSDGNRFHLLEQIKGRY